MPAEVSLTGQLRLYSNGSREGADSMFREILPRLREIAARKLSKERFLAPLSPTELIGETWLASLRRGRWKIENREHFFSIVGLAMENVLTDMARRRLAQRRGKGVVALSLDDLSPGQQPSSAEAEQVLAISMLLEKLARADASAANVVRLHYLAGFSLEEIAHQTGSSLRQVRHRWEKGKLWLAKRLTASAGD
jgi:RNA polymerase sigma factor (TIGR02999 family)